MVAMLSHRKPLPPLTQTQDHAIPVLYAAVQKTGHFMAKRTDPESLDVRIIPSAYPKHLIGDDFEMMSITGVVRVRGSQGTVVDLDRFVEDTANEFIVERQMFRLKYTYRMFYLSRERYRDRQFKRSLTASVNRSSQI
jgi:hypothetical protein